MKRQVIDLLNRPLTVMVKLPSFDGNDAWFEIDGITIHTPATRDMKDERYKIKFKGGLSQEFKRDDILDVFNVPKLTGKKNFKTPRLLVADAYTVGSDEFVSKECKEKSTYYLTFRKKLSTVNEFLYGEGNDKMIFMGAQRIIDTFFRYPVTHDEIDEALLFLEHFKVTTLGLKKYSCPEKMWRRVVDEFNGYPPIEIKGVPEGSVIYPNEPALQITNIADGFGELAAWFESKLLQVWAATERVTQDIHWKNKLADMVQGILKCSRKEALEKATNMIHDFGDRAGMNHLESENFGMAHLYNFSGTDTVAGAYQAFKSGAVVPGVSVKALAHRIVQGYEKEGDAYRAIYDACENGDIDSSVADCNDYYTAVQEYLLPLAMESRSTTNGKIVVARPDSGDAEEQCLWLCKLAKRYGLYEELVIDGKTWYKGTYLKFIEGDGMTFPVMIQICNKLLEYGFLPWEWGVPFGVGGGLRNNLKRDDFSAKYALNAKSKNNDGVVKFSEIIGKTTLPGPFKLLRSEQAFTTKKTIVGIDEPGEDKLSVYYSGNPTAPFGINMQDGFENIKLRIEYEFETFPNTLWTDENHGYPASDAIREKRIELLQKYAPKSHKRKENY